MGKGKRQRERREAAALRSRKRPVKGAALVAIEGGVPLEDRPEYKAQMKAWRAAGSVPPQPHRSIR